MSISASGRPVGPAPRWIIVGFHLCAWPSLDLPPDGTAKHWRRHLQSADLIYDSYLMLWAGSMMMRPRKPLAHVLGGECRVWASMAAHDFRPGRRGFFPQDGNSHLRQILGPVWPSGLFSSDLFPGTFIFWWRARLEREEKARKGAREGFGPCAVQSSPPPNSTERC